MFLELLDRATSVRLEQRWIVWLLPAIGIIVGVTYHRLAGRAAGGTGFVIRESRSLHGGVPARMAPLILAGTLLGHLGGASVGREGTALQVSASLTDGLARRMGVGPADRRVLLPAAVAGGFAAVFGVPGAGVVFAVTVAAAWHPLTVVACLVASLVGDWVVGVLGHDHTSFPQVPAVDWSAGLIGRLILLGFVGGVLARLFVTMTAVVRRWMVACVERSWLRPAIGAGATLALMGLVGRDYLGLSLPLIGNAFDGSEHSWTVPVLKLIFTALALGSGFVGGEVTPLFIVGATAGASVASLTGAASLAGPLSTVVLFVACGFVVVFACAASATMAGVVMAVELFGWHVVVPALLVGTVARLVAGRPGLYVSRCDIASRPAVEPAPNR